MLVLHFLILSVRYCLIWLCLLKDNRTPVIDQSGTILMWYISDRGIAVSYSICICEINAHRTNRVRWTHWTWSCFSWLDQVFCNPWKSNPSCVREFAHWRCWRRASISCGRVVQFANKLKEFPVDYRLRRFSLYREPMSKCLLKCKLLAESPRLEHDAEQ